MNWWIKFIHGPEGETEVKDYSKLARKLGEIVIVWIFINIGFLIAFIIITLINLYGG